MASQSANSLCVADHFFGLLVGGPVGAARAAHKSVENRLESFVPSPAATVTTGDQAIMATFWTDPYNATQHCRLHRS